MLKGKKILITGGTGSLGQALTKRLLKSEVEIIRILSRNESKQVEMESKFHDDRLRFFIGDIRDQSRLIRATEDIDIVFHAAALKHVPVMEYNPFEGIQTNVVGSQNVIDACIHENVEVSVGVGTDKAVSPLNTYGATKLLMEKLFVAAHNYVHAPRHKTKFLAVRYGNVLGSAGSVVPKFIQQIRSKQKITITDPNMTRFSITMNEALDFILNSTAQSKGGGIFVPKLRSYSIMDLKDALFDLLGDYGVEYISARPGEKMHETLINEDEIRNTWELDGNYIVFDPLIKEEKIKELYPNISPIKTNKPYNSSVAEKISIDELKKNITESGLLD
jgi:UDP-N-acetylglucosamine 4,6-dehydratase/5-epimerase